MLYAPLRKNVIDVALLYKQVEKCYQLLGEHERQQYRKLNMVIRYSQELLVNPQIFNRQNYSNIQTKHLRENNKRILLKIATIQFPKAIRDSVNLCTLFLRIESQEVMLETIKKGEQSRDETYAAHLSMIAVVKENGIRQKVLEQLDYMQKKQGIAKITLQTARQRIQRGRKRVQKANEFKQSIANKKTINL